MKRILNIVLLITLVFVVLGFGQKGGAERELQFERYDSYFEKNNSGLKGRTSYLVITSQPKFDEVFGPAATMGHNTFLPEKTFDTKLVIATITRGRFLRTYDLTKVTVKNGRIYVWYKIKDSAEGSASFRSPLILAVDKNNYSQIIFKENGKTVGKVSVKRK
jgi:inhibitor of cysteine peptidase